MTTRTAGEVDEAIRLWDQLQAGLFLVEDTIQEIILKKAWEPLGYESFFEAWDDKMSHIELAKQLNIRVAYQMLAEGVDVDRIALAVKGVGPETIKNIKRERENGVPAHAARGSSPRSKVIIDKPITVREHGREKASPDSFIRFEVGPTMRAQYERIASKLGRSVPDIAKEGTAKIFAELAKVK